MKHNKYKIIFDTNIVFCNEENQLDKIFNSSLKEIFDLLDQNKVVDVTLFIPQLVLDERIAQRLSNIREQVEKMNLSLKNLKSLGKMNTKRDVFEKDRFLKKLNRNALKAIKKHKIKIIPTTRVDQKILIQRALQRIAPFYARGKKDNGFKDTLIWLSLLEDVRKTQGCNYILFTNDSTGFKEDICEKEFKKYSLANFWIIKDLTSLKEFLDKELELGLKLGEIYHEVKEEVRSLQGTITTKAGCYINNPKASLQFFSESYCSTAERESGNFDFYSMDIINISRLGNNEFNVNVDISFVVSKFKEKDFLSHIILDHTRPESENEIVKYNVDLNYKRGIKSIKIISMTKSAYSYPDYYIK